MKNVLLGHNTEVIEGEWAFVYKSEKEAKEALKNVDTTYSENGKSDYELVTESEIVVSDENYNPGLNAYKQ